ncbi:Spy/CpxP family protein refolding chaperone [Halanaerobium saccharolyticum]|uniref:Spy/CpxP family protein refolding chaperone n=1 Tax=Halanaerobium saccharolyticum TaxID=43595 RepID=UPI003FCD682C
MKKLLISLMVLAFVVSVFTGAVFAQGPQSKMGPAANQPRYNEDAGEFGIGYNRVELSEEQINEIADLRNEFYTQTEDLRDQLRDLNRELRDQEFRGASNAEIGEIEDKIEEVLVQMDEKRLSNQEKIEAVLTEEQLALIAENRQNYEERYQNRFNNDFGPGSQRGFGRSGYSRFDEDYHYGMMGRSNFGARSGGFRSGGAYNRSVSGFGPGWCH